MDPASNYYRYLFGDFEYSDFELRHREDGRRSVTGKTRLLLQCLLEAGGRVVTRDELREQVWPDSFVDNRTINSRVNSLRNVIGHDAIETVTGVGYRLVLDVTREPTRRELAAPADSSPVSEDAAKVVAAQVAQLRRSEPTVSDPRPAIGSHEESPESPVPPPGDSPNELSDLNHAFGTQFLIRKGIEEAALAKYIGCPIVVVVGLALLCFLAWHGFLGIEEALLLFIAFLHGGYATYAGAADGQALSRAGYRLTDIDRAFYGVVNFGVIMGRPLCFLLIPFSSPETAVPIMAKLLFVFAILQGLLLTTWWKARQFVDNERYVDATSDWAKRTIAYFNHRHLRRELEMTLITLAAAALAFWSPILSLLVYAGATGRNEWIISEWRNARGFD